MARIILLHHLLTIFLTVMAAAVSGQTTNFIESSCSTTTYPSICIESLSIYAISIGQSPRQLAQIALSVSLSKAEKTKTFISKLTKFKGLQSKEYETLNICLNKIGGSVDRLTKSVQKLKHMGQAEGLDFLWHMSNVETWISAAQSDENSCIDGFDGNNLNGKIKDSIRVRVLNVVQVTSNALALIHRFASRN